LTTIPSNITEIKSSVKYVYPAASYNLNLALHLNMSDQP